MLASAALTRTTLQSTAVTIAMRVLRRLIRKVLLSPSTWIILAVAVSLAIVANLRTFQSTVAAPARDAADQYVEALKSGDVDTFLASLSPDARTALGVFGRYIGPPGTPAERRAARTVVARDHIDGYTRLGQHSTEDGSFVVYAVERDASDGTHTQPLVVWLDQSGHVVRTTM